MRAIAMTYPVGISDIDIAKIKQFCKQCYLRYRTRKQLARLSPERLRDVGITPEQAKREAAKPFWKS